MLPFLGCAQYVPELNKLWFGISSREHGCLLCASDLSGASKTQPPALHAALALEDTAARAPDGFDLVTARAIYLGSGKFCLARIFATPMRISLFEDTEPEQFAVMAGVQVVPSSDGGKSVTMVERHSQRYVLNDDETYWLL